MNALFPQAMNALIPQTARILSVRRETADTKTFCIADENGAKPFAHLPGQCAMLGIPGVGEAMFSIASSPTNTKYYEFSIKAVGKLTNALHTLQSGAALTIRGPFGTPFPVEGVLKGRDLLIAAGGIGMAPLRSVIRYIFDNRSDYGTLDIVYGARSAADLVFYEEMQQEWTAMPDTRLYLTIDNTEAAWEGHVGYVPNYIKEISFTPKSNGHDRIALICGPPVMIKYTTEALLGMGFTKTQIYTTLEMRMKCGVGKCGRCNIGHKYVCIDGPVFRCDELDTLPEEY